MLSMRSSSVREVLSVVGSFMGMGLRQKKTARLLGWRFSGFVGCA
jgi:hypothetical protein